MGVVYRLALVSLGLATALAAPLLPADSESVWTDVTGSCAVKEGYVIGMGHDIGHHEAASQGACCTLCQNTPACAAYTWHTDSTCWLHDSIASWHPEEGVVSGVPSGPLPPEPSPEPPMGSGGGYGCVSANVTGLPFCDVKLPLSQRAEDLADRVAVGEMASQLTARQCEPIERLDVPSYYWGTNAIHGMQNVACLPSGMCPTSFPAPVGLAASFDMGSVHSMGDIIGKEMRAYYNAKVHNSLDTWSPTININRDPRWGRNVESPGEDPYLAGAFGSAYTEGLQQLSSDTDLVQAVVTLKHWLAYSIEDYNGTTRHNVDVKVSAYDLATTYLPAWETLVREAGALGIMCSYNMVNGRPTCANPMLNKTLREDWGFKGYITSDSDSCGDIYTSHHFEDTGALATRDCLQGGTDIDSGGTYTGYLANGIEGGEVSIDDARKALTNSYKMRMRMGLFDPSVDNPYRHISLDVVGSEEHVEASVEASRKTMVLLKNDGGVLPFKLGASVAVIGQAVNDTTSYTGNYDGPLCHDKPGASCFPALGESIRALNAQGSTTVVASTDAHAAAAAAASADCVVVLVDNAKDGGGEGHDRYTLGLSADQTALFDAVIAVGKPTVLVVLNGGLISLDGLIDKAPAILEAFMPGVYGGKTMAETIFGINNPGGKMPVTMYPSSYADEVDFLDMSMTAGPGRSYKYYSGTALFPFGFGLSYTTFEMSWSPRPPVASWTVSGADQSKTYSCTVKNTGSVTGDEVVMAFIVPKAATLSDSLGPDVPVEKRRLVGFERITLKPDQSTTVQFNISASNMAMTDADGHVSLHGGEFEVELTRGHSEALRAPILVAARLPTRLSTFRRWW